MADGTKIEWTDATWNVVNGCSLASPGCTNCYAMKQAHRVDCRRGLTVKTKGGMVWTGETRFNDKVLFDPIRWRRPRRIFVCAHGDLFHESVPDEWIDKVFAVMVLAPQHQFQVLTKRSARMREWMVRLERAVRDWFERCDPDGLNDSFPHVAGAIAHPAGPREWPLPNVWLGVSVENQHYANERIPDLLNTPAAIRWISAEPLLGPIDLTCIEFPNKTGGLECWDALFCDTGGEDAASWSCSTVTLDWVVAGGESGPNARTMNPAWVEALFRQCETAGTAFLFKQWGEYLPDRIERGDPRSLNFPPGHVIYNKVGKKAAGRKLYGVEHNGFPA